MHYFEQCASHGIPTETAACLLRSIEINTHCAYLHSWKLFANWCSQQKINYSTLSINHVCSFLVYLFQSGHQVSYLNVTRSGLSFFLSHLFIVGDDYRIKRLFRYFWRRQPVRGATQIPANSCNSCIFFQKQAVMLFFLLTS